MMYYFASFSSWNLKYLMECLLKGYLCVWVCVCVCVCVCVYSSPREIDKDVLDNLALSLWNFLRVKKICYWIMH